MGQSISLAVTGATGALGGRVAARLAPRGIAQRLVVRDLLPVAEPLPGPVPALDLGGRGEASPSTCARPET